jgi:hypothetical protein
MTLSDKHLTMLRDGSGIADDVIEARGYRTITDAKDLSAKGFSPAQCRVPGLLLPLHTTDGGNGQYVYRPDNPRIHEDRSKREVDGSRPNKVIKYEMPKGAGIRLDCPPICQPQLADPHVSLWITEGQKKADALASRGQCVVALLGVWNFKGKNKFGASTFLADWDYIALKDRIVRIVFDSDVMGKPEIHKALRRLTEHLQRKGAHVEAVYLPAGSGGKVGVDDWLVLGHTVEELASLVEGPRPEVKAAEPIVELLDTTPAIITRPLALLDGISYAATWLPVKVTIKETRDKAGNIIKLNPSRVTTERRLFIIRHDGRIFGDGGNEPIESIGAEVRLPEVPPANRLWSSLGVKRYAGGSRSAPASVFRRVVDIVDRFIDFNKSLADQRTMAALTGCYILATWFLDGFNVIGFLWPNGDRGSGKTQLLHIVCELAYLGQVILAGGSFASLRDMADYGACLAFDDAENLSDPRRTDPDKRALLLAGNRRGNTVPVKESKGDRGWVTRYVNTYCPRLFSATRLPDPILASRTIVVPLIRTPDKHRANADPLEYGLWPHDLRLLLDDLWAVALEHLPDMPAYEAEVNSRATLAGRNLEPWRAVLAVALWLEQNGVPGIFGRMETLSVAYQSERIDLEPGDLTALVVRALCHYAITAVDAVNGEIPERFTFKTSQIVEETKILAEEIEADIDAESINSRRVGRVLGKMRLKPDRDSKKKGWCITRSEIERWAISYGVPFQNANDTTPPLNGTNETNGITAQVSMALLDDGVSTRDADDWLNVTVSAVGVGADEAGIG